MSKFALLIVTMDYTDPALAQLSALRRDAEEFGHVLKSDDGCAFDDVRVLSNEPESTVREALEGFFAERKTDDLLLLYFFGHAVRDEQGVLYLAFKNSDRSDLASTGIQSDFIRECMNGSRSRRQVLILDCRNSRVLTEGTQAKTGGSMGLKYAFEGSGFGRVVLAASDVVQFTWRGAKASGKADHSLFTRFLIEGLQGQADQDGDGIITANELYQYAHAQTLNITPKQAPQIWFHSQEGKMILRQGVGPGQAQPVPAPTNLSGASKRLFATIGQLQARVRRHTLLILFLSVVGLFLLGLVVYGPPVSPTNQPVPASFAGRVQIHWFVGLGTGTAPEQVAMEEQVVRDFNASQNKIELILLAAPGNYDVTETQFATDSGPDIIGPVDWHISNFFQDQWLDLAPYIQEAGFDTSVFDPTLMDFYRSAEGQTALPFALYPSALYYNPAMFDEAGLAYPPQQYGEKYTLPGGREVDWNWDTVTQVARLLTIDKNGHNATEPSFDRSRITQVGYSLQGQGPNAMASSYAGPAVIFEGAARGSYKSIIPAGWKAAFKWYYDGIWGTQPFMASGALSNSVEFGSGNLFNAGRSAMAPSAYSCCLSDIARTDKGFQLGILPIGADGLVHGRITADTFHIWQGSHHPQEAFQVLAYLITTGSDKLLPVYNAVSAHSPRTDNFFARKSRDYPFITRESWNVLAQALTQPDSPSAEQNLPNWSEAYTREQSFMNNMSNTPPDVFDFERQFKLLQDNLTTIYNK